MKILRKYNDYLVGCKSCNLLLSIEVTDVVGDDCGVLHHYNGEDCFTKCPVCEKIIPMFSKNLPQEWLSKIYPIG